MSSTTALGPGGIVRMPDDQPPAPHPMDLDTALRLVALGAPMPDAVHREVERTLVAELQRLRTDQDQMSTAILDVETQRVSVIAAGGDDGTGAADWSAQHVPQAVRDGESGEWIAPGWYVLGHAPGEPEDHYATLHVQFAVDPDGREDAEGVATRLAALLNPAGAEVARAADGQVRGR